MNGILSWLREPTTLGGLVGLGVTFSKATGADWAADPQAAAESIMPVASAGVELFALAAVSLVSLVRRER